MSRARIAGGLAALAAAGLVAWLMLDSPAPREPASSDTAAPEPARRAEPARDQPALPAAPAEPGDPPARPGVEAEQAPPEDDAVSLPPPPPEDEIALRPEREAATAEDRRATQQAALELVDRSIERLEAEGRQAEAAGDTRAAERNRVRVERLRQRRDALAAELEQASP